MIDITNNVVVRTRVASPSKLAIFKECPLRYLRETEPGQDNPIKAHPVALLGTAVHQAVEQLLKQPSWDAMNCKQMVEANFISLASEKRNVSALTEWTLAKFGVFGLLSRRQLIEQVSFAMSLSERYATDYKSTERFSLIGPSEIPLGTERWLDSPSIGVAGKVDLIYKNSDGKICIVDFKTGKVNDAEGNPKLGYLIQLAAYGRIITELDPAINVKLELFGRTDSWSATFDVTMKSLIDKTLSEFSDLLPMQTEIQSRSLAIVGDHCSSCNFRPHCGAYLQDLDDRMGAKEFFYEKSAFDIFGEVLDSSESDGLTSLQCVIKNGNVIKISRIPNEILPKQKVNKGTKIAAFGLASLESNLPGTFPCNFFLFNQENSRKSAFQSYLSLTS